MTDRTAEPVVGKAKPFSPVRRVAVAGLVCLVWVVFFPILTFEFIDFDVPTQVIDNPYIRGLTFENVSHILTSRCITSYYPVRTLSYAIDYQLWGLSPRGFKFTNGLIHTINVLLVFWLIVRLRHRAARGNRPSEGPRDMLTAAFFAGVFAIHPVVVEPVAWVAGREELLMTLGALGCVHFHITARRLAQEHRISVGDRSGDEGAKKRSLGGAKGNRRLVMACHVGATVCCLAACLSNAVGAVIPFLIVTWDLLVLPRPKWRKILVGTSPLWIIAIATILIKTIGYAQHPALQKAEALSAVIDQLGDAGQTSGGEPGLLDFRRITLPLGVYWLNVKALIFPKDLTLTYMVPKPEKLTDTRVIMGVIVVLSTCAILWLCRRQRLALFGFLWFLLALGPVAQIVPYHILRSDRFLYLPLVGLSIGFAMIVRRAIERLTGPATPTGSSVWQLAARRAVMAAAVLVILLLGITAAGQVRTWRNDLTVWQHCVRRIPNSHVAHQKLADALAEAKQFERAFSHYRTALKLNVFDVKAASRFARALATCDEHQQRDYELALRLAAWAHQLTEGTDPHVNRTLGIVHNNFADTLRERGDFAEAIAEYRRAIQADPTYPGPQFNLALLLAICPDEQLRDIEEAFRLAEQACQKSPRADANGWMILALICDQMGQPDKAIRATEQAIAAAQAEGNLQQADQLQNRLKLYRAQTAEDPAGK
jgi:tetratricopeptide (TPR) repeat protein